MVSALDRHKRAILVCVVLSLATFALFLPVRECGFLNFDDNLYVTQNDLVSHGLSWRACNAALTATYGCNWHPATTISHMLDCQLYGLKPAGHHLTNVLIHAVNAVLLFGLLRTLTGAFWRGAMVAALFAWHPLHVESVAWVAERKDVLSTFFALLSLFAYAGYVRRKDGERQDINLAEQAEAGKDQAGVAARPEESSSKNRRNRRNLQLTRGSGNAPRNLYYAFSLALFALGLASKPMVVTLPFVMLLLDFWPLERLCQPENRWENIRRLIWEKVPFFILSALSCLITLWVQGRGGALESLEEIPLSARYTNTAVAYVRYIELMFYPAGLAVPYPHPGHYPALRVTVAALIFVGLTMIALWQARRRPYLLVGWCWYVGMLVPVIGLVQVGDQAIADRYTYLPLVGLFVAIVWWLADLVGERPFARSCAIAGAAVVLLGCAFATRVQLQYWKSSGTLFAHTLKVTRDNAWAEVNYGCALYDERQFDAARIRFLNALKLKPRFAMTYLNLGKVSQAMGDDSEALNYLQQALALAPDNSETALAHAIALVRMGRLDEAAAAYAAALAAHPANAMLQCNYGLLLSRQGNTDEALNHFYEAIRLDPTMMAAQLEIGNLLARTGRTEEAMAAFRQSMKLQPTNDTAHINLGGLFEQLGQTENALLEYHEAVRVQPESARAHSNLGVLLAKEGKPAEAEIHFKRFTELESTNANAFYNLGNVLLAQKKFGDAELQYSNSISLNPKDADASYKLAVCQIRQGKSSLGAESLRKTVQLNPNHATALIDLAWMLAASPDPAIRNGDEAVKTARRACEVTKFGDINSKGAYDAALAEAGRFSEAIEAAGKTRTLALAIGQSELADAAARREALYRQNQPFRLP